MKDMTLEVHFDRKRLVVTDDMNKRHSLGLDDSLLSVNISRPEIEYILELKYNSCDDEFLEKEFDKISGFMGKIRSWRDVEVNRYYDDECLKTISISGCYRPRIGDFGKH